VEREVAERERSWSYINRLERSHVPYILLCFEMQAYQTSVVEAGIRISHFNKLRNLHSPVPHHLDKFHGTFIGRFSGVHGPNFTKVCKDILGDHRSLTSLFQSLAILLHFQTRAAKS